MFGIYHQHMAYYDVDGLKMRDSYKKGDVTNSEDDESVDFAP